MQTWRNKTLLILIVILGLMSFVSSIEIKPLNSGANYKSIVTCTNLETGSLCSATATCNMSLYDNSGQMLVRGVMSKSNNEYNYTINGNLLIKKGLYGIKYECFDTDASSTAEEWLSVGEDRDNPLVNLIPLIILITAGAFNYFIIYKKNRFFGNLVFIAISSLIIYMGQGLEYKAGGTVLLIGSLVSWIYDVSNTLK